MCFKDNFHRFNENYVIICVVQYLAWHGISVLHLKVVKMTDEQRFFPAALPFGAAMLALDHLSLRLPRGRRLPGARKPQIQLKTSLFAAFFGRLGLGLLPFTFLVWIYQKKK